MSGIQSCHRRDHLAYCEAVSGAIDRLADAVARSEPAAPVPSCPGWTVGDLVEHVGGVHRWAARMVREVSPARLARRDLGIDFPGDPAEWPEWLRHGAEELVTSLRGANPDAAMWAWGADKHARFWGRRMLHETTVHRVDVELAGGPIGAVDAAEAVDGIDELLDNLPHAAYFRPAVEQLRGHGETLAFEARDAGVRWAVRLLPDGYEWGHEDGPADAVVSAPAAALFLYLYQRAGGEAVTIDGDALLVDRWLANSTL
jgi:uncharacterized protein (TIGR03083 family)